MEEIFNLLPEIILYLASGFVFICGFYFLIDKRFDFFSEISFWIILILGFLWTNLIKSIPNFLKIEDESVKSILVIIGSLLIGLAVATIRNCFEKYGENLSLSLGRRKTFSPAFWYSVLDDPDKPMTIRLRNYEKEFILEGVLLRISENDENPYLLLGYCVKYNLNGKVIDKSLKKDRCTQVIVKTDSFDEISIVYSDGSSKIIDINIIE